MNKIFLTAIFAFLFVSSGYSQKQKVSKADQATLDSMLKKDEFLNMDKDKKGSSLDLSVGIGNGAFGSHNRATNAAGVNNQVIFTPGVFYHHETGLGIGATVYIASDSGNSGLYQTGITGSYDYDGDDVKAGLSYTRYISDPNKYNSKSIYQNDIYSYIKAAKGAIRPLFSVGYSSGTYKEVAAVLYTPPFPFPQIARLVHDSTNNTASAFTLTGGVEHEFQLSNVFDKEDELEIVPSILLNAGSSKLAINHTNAAYAKLPKRSQRFKNTTTNEAFQFQSVTAALDISYNIGKFFAQPSIYVDYFLPTTTSNRLTAIYSFTIGWSF